MIIEIYMTIFVYIIIIKNPIYYNNLNNFQNFAYYASFII